MKEHLIAYFDLLGYKQFIKNNDEELTSIRVKHILRDIENSLALRKTKPINPGGIIADLEYSKVNCLNISDTIILWTDDYSNESVKYFIKVCFNLNFMLNKWTFPCRGVLISDKFEIISGKKRNSAGYIYSPNIMYGKGLLKAHMKCESFNFAGTIIDKSFIDRFLGNETIIETTQCFCMKYLIPYKEHQANQEHEFAFKFTTGYLNDEYFENVREEIINNFRKDNKEVNEEVQLKIDNTIEFLRNHPWK
ncbi:hypothetical protein [Riemerella anatipestifer]|uniref:hypothetical protein n=1 Tax=Riemerella anatipestifer TaxID=34085 RepID=UPI0013733486|nr:hypothetical protein [Riemerella anatipestifer]MBT0549956.1 hypothetical protein [Riemerella anatipestifer]MBT0556778.1 hypothetical protein [Riemerella anatipestifer]MBT0560738.1 hypothetical protein [Riemerella anatipestifer]MCW0488463.1 hypothetical protein [Riemerella anatipestifer]MDY3525947.1 hypothetical protein [Riemerella anatipestifer]